MFRFAPSPTGDMHIGNLRAALFNFIMAKKLGQKFFIRIEDTDLARNIKGKDKQILELLNLFGITYDFLNYQSSNKARHHEVANALLANDLAFKCYCSKAFLEAKKQEFLESKRPFRYDDDWTKQNEATCGIDDPTIRLKKSAKAIEFNDEIKGNVSFQPHELDSFVILREDLSPTYNFACAVDDADFGVNFIIRGEDHVSNTPRQIMIKDAMNNLRLAPKSDVKYAHLPIILGSDGKKLSKRDSSSSVVFLLENGFLPEAIANYLILMGNHTPKEIFTLNEAIAFFDIAKLSKAPVKFDLNMLRHINREHLKLKDAHFFDTHFELKDAKLGELCMHLSQEFSTLLEIKAALDLMLAPKDIKSTQDLDNLANNAKKIHDVITDLLSQNANLGSYNDFKISVMAKSGLKGKDFFKPLRVLLTGQSHGIELELLYPLISHKLSEIIRLKENRDKEAKE
ncbi:MAG: glutamate--tRNA ligase [Helicobacter sp.]|nr:glutamate--tRNA ligase [Helicobacter sp.]